VSVTRTPAVRTLGALLREHRALLSVIAVAELVSIIMVSAINPHDHIDGEVYWLGAKAWLHGQAVYHNLPATESGLQLPFIYPPFAAIVFSPLGLLSRTHAIILLMASTHVTLLVTLYLVLGTAPLFTDPLSGRRRRDKVMLVTAAVLPLCTISEPVMETITYAQINIVLMAMVAIDCLWRIDGNRKLPYPRGLLIGLAAGVKLTPAVFLLFLLLRRDFRAMLVAAASFAGTVLVGLVLAFNDSREFWLSQVFGSGSVTFGSKYPGNAAIYAGNQSLRALLTRFGLPEPWQTLVLGVLILIALALSIAGMLHARRQGNLPLAMTINGVLGLLASPISWSHHWVWAIPAIALLVLGSAVRRDWPLLTATALTAGLFVIGPHWEAPQGDFKELHWNFFEQLLGNAYIYLGFGFLIYAASGWWSAWRRMRAIAKKKENPGPQPIASPQTV
jgi:alpha-1,2-mannosyltransferase